MINEEEKYDVANAMICYGGSFVCYLGQALQHADLDNQEKIKSTWPEYWKQYYEIAQKKKSTT